MLFSIRESGKRSSAWCCGIQRSRLQDMALPWPDRSIWFSAPLLRRIPRLRHASFIIWRQGMTASFASMCRMSSAPFCLTCGDAASNGQPSLLSCSFMAGRCQRETAPCTASLPRFSGEPEQPRYALCRIIRKNKDTPPAALRACSFLCSGG